MTLGKLYNLSVLVSSFVKEDCQKKKKGLSEHLSPKLLGGLNEIVFKDMEHQARVSTQEIIKL